MAKTKQVGHFEPIVIKSISDIKKAIEPFNKEIPENRVPFTTKFEVNDNGKKDIVDVSAYSSDFNFRKSLLDGFNQVFEQKKMWSKLKDTLDDDEYATHLPEVDIDTLLMPVDRLIKYRLGGKRKGQTIVWNINNKDIIYNPFDKTLDQVNAQTTS